MSRHICHACLIESHGLAQALVTGVSCLAHCFTASSPQTKPTERPHRSRPRPTSGFGTRHCPCCSATTPTPPAPSWQETLVPEQSGCRVLRKWNVTGQSGRPSARGPDRLLRRFPLAAVAAPHKLYDRFFPPNACDTGEKHPVFSCCRLWWLWARPPVQAGVACTHVDVIERGRAGARTGGLAGDQGMDRANDAMTSKTRRLSRLSTIAKQPPGTNRDRR